MARITRKVNFLLEDAVYRDLENLVPAGKRSQVVNEALRKELELVRRKQAVEALLAASTSGKKFSTQKIVELLAADRQNH
jgi:hypothetical protein